MKEKIISVDIISDIIKTSYTGGRYKGEEVNKLLTNKIDELTASSLLIIDFQKANPLDYVFCQYAFGPILKIIQDNNKPTVFRMQPMHKRCFYRGILKHIDKTLPRKATVEESEKIFFDTGIFTMISIVDKENVDFIGKLALNDSSILNYINESNSVSEREIIDAKKEFQPTEIIESLRSLNKKGFILNPKDGSDKYCSVYKLLKN